VLIQQNLDGSNFFNRSWAEFKVGFNNTFGNYWIGNDLLSQLTLSGRYKLRFDLQARHNRWYWAEYSRFFVSDESHNYQLQVSGFSGNINSDAFGYHDEMMFTTYDRDNDQWDGRGYNTSNCAVYNGGGFWHKSCSRCNVNTVPGRGEDFIWWASRFSVVLLQTSRMWLMC